jgi:hypothetical protein
MDRGDYLRTLRSDGDILLAAAKGAMVAAGSPKEAAMTLRGGASDLVLALWRRLPIDAIDVSGDRDLAARFLATADLD